MGEARERGGMEASEGLEAVSEKFCKAVRSDFYRPGPGDTVLLPCPHCERIARPSGESACPDDACQSKARQEHAFRRLSDRPDSGASFSGFAQAVVEHSDELVAKGALTHSFADVLREALKAQKP